MEDLTNAFNSINLSDLKYDVQYLIFCYKTNINQIDIDTTKFRLPAGYSSTHKLYYDILKMIYSLNETHIVLEMMPLIDDYLEYYHLRMS